MIDPEYVRSELDARETEELVDILVARDEEAWRPEVFPIVEEVLRARDVRVADVIDARRRELAARAAPAPDPERDEPVVVAEFDDEMEAQMCRMALAQAGIEADLSAPPPSDGATALLRLVVKKADADAAREVLASTENVAPEDAADGFRCSSCGFIAEPLREDGRLVCQVCGATE